MGPRPDLIGRRSSELGLPTVAAKIEQLAQLASVDPDSRFLPAYLSGTISSPHRPAGALQLAVAVNGIVQATTLSIVTSNGGRGFAVLVPPAAYRAGTNQVQLLDVATAR